MSENRHPPHRETVQALVGVTVIAIGLVTTLVLHVTHDGDPSPPRPAPHATSTPFRPGVPAAPAVTAKPGCCAAPLPAPLALPTAP